MVGIEDTRFFTEEPLLAKFSILKPEIFIRVQTLKREFVSQIRDMPIELAANFTEMMENSVVLGWIDIDADGIELILKQDSKNHLEKVDIRSWTNILAEELVRSKDKTKKPSPELIEDYYRAFFKLPQLFAV